jgi:hypothetical protein
MPHDLLVTATPGGGVKEPVKAIDDQLGELAWVGFWDIRARRTPH